eukprot:1145821-Pelagomonas_calceolata.AAC.2
MHVDFERILKIGEICVNGFPPGPAPGIPVSAIMARGRRRGRSGVWRESLLVCKHSASSLARLSLILRLFWDEVQSPQSSGNEGSVGSLCEGVWSLKTTVCRMLKRCDAPDTSCAHIMQEWAVAVLKLCSAIMASGAKN